MKTSRKKELYKIPNLKSILLNFLNWMIMGIKVLWYLDSIF